MSQPVFAEKNVLFHLPPAPPRLESIEWGILLAIVYSDIFDYPMTVDEIHRYMVEVQATPDQVREALFSGNLIPEFVSKHQEFFSLAGRSEIIQLRARRSVCAKTKWNHALKFGTLIAALPYVRMVAVTGALALDNVERDADLDFLIVTSPGRLWLCRAMTLLVVQMARIYKIEICPNYFLAENSLLIQEQNLFTARELAQMVPIFGWDTYLLMRRINTWVLDYLPNSAGPPVKAFPFLHRNRFPSDPARYSIETILGLPPGSSLESWEMNRKIRKLTPNFSTGGEFEFNSMTCKGHLHGHGGNALRKFDERVDRLLSS